jgi:hypothetical protein
MKTFAEFSNLSENFKNLVGASSLEDRKIWADRVWELLQKAYHDIGGIKGSGFESVGSMIRVLPFWKLAVKGDRVLVVILYKDKGGRKIVAMATDQSPESKPILNDILKAGLKTGWAEISGPVLGYVMKNIGLTVIKPFLLTPEEVTKTSGDETFRITPEIISDLNKHDAYIYRRYQPMLGDNMYVREIGGEPHLKIAFGSPHKTIS